MSKASRHSFELGRTRPSAPMIDRYTIVPILACVYASIVSPLILATCSPADRLCLLESRPDNKIFWPVVTAISIILVLRNRSRLTLPPHIICLFAYLALAGASVLWSVKPELSFIRIVQEVMIVTSIVLPAMLRVGKADMLHGLFLCFALGSILNFLFILITGAQSIADHKLIGYEGYFLGGKNILGQFAAVALFLALNEMRFSGIRRAVGILVAAICAMLLFLSNSKTSLGFALLAPFLAGMTLMIGRRMRISVAIVLLSLIGLVEFCYIVSPYNINDLSQFMFGDRTFTGRTFIWDLSLIHI